MFTNLKETAPHLNEEPVYHQCSRLLLGTGCSLFRRHPNVYIHTICASCSRAQTWWSACLDLLWRQEGNVTKYKCGSVSGNIHCRWMCGRDTHHNRMLSSKNIQGLGSALFVQDNTPTLRQKVNKPELHVQPYLLRMFHYSIHPTTRPIKL